MAKKTALFNVLYAVSKMCVILHNRHTKTNNAVYWSHELRWKITTTAEAMYYTNSYIHIIDILEQTKGSFIWWGNKNTILTCLNLIHTTTTTQHCRSCKQNVSWRIYDADHVIKWIIQHIATTIDNLSTKIWRFKRGEKTREAFH